MSTSIIEIPLFTQFTRFETKMNLNNELFYLNFHYNKRAEIYDLYYLIDVDVDKKYFKIRCSDTDNFDREAVIEIQDSTGNDGYYTIKRVHEDSPFLTLQVREIIANATIDGKVGVNRSGSWFLDISDSDNNKIISGIRLATNMPVDYQYDSFANKPDGHLIFLEMSGKKLEVGRFDLGDKGRLIFVPSSELDLEELVALSISIFQDTGFQDTGSDTPVGGWA